MPQFVDDLAGWFSTIPSWVGLVLAAIGFAAALVSQRRGAQARARGELARQEAEEARHIKNDFVAMVSHELRTPLNAVVGWSRLLRSGQLDKDGVTHAVEHGPGTPWSVFALRYRNFRGSTPHHQ